MAKPCFTSFVTKLKSVNSIYLLQQQNHVRLGSEKFSVQSCLNYSYNDELLCDYKVLFLDFFMSHFESFQK